MLIVLGRLFMRGSKGVGAGVPDHPLYAKSTNKAVDYLEKYKANDVGSSSDRLYDVLLAGRWWPVLVTGYRFS